MAARFAPEDGDIVVREEERDGTRLYILHDGPGLVHVLSVREEAVARALRRAETRQVRVWLADGRDDFTLIEDFRVA